MNAVAVTTCMVNARTGATAAMAVYIATRGTGAVVAMNAVAGTTCMVNATTFATTAKAKDRGATIIRTIAVAATNAVAVTTCMVNARTGATAAMAVSNAGVFTNAVVAANAVKTITPTNATADVLRRTAVQAAFTMG